MRSNNFVAIIFFFFYSVSFSQQDTLYEEDLRKVGDILFQNLKREFYGPALMDRALSTNATTLSQTRGNYSQVHSVTNFFELYEDLSLAYTDSTFMKSPPQLGEYIYNFFDEFDSDSLEGEIDVLIQPFGLLYHYVSHIDSNFINSNSFTVDQFHLSATVNENNIYQTKLYKSAAILEFYPENGYQKGYLRFDQGLISTSPGISNLQIKINIGKGFVLLNEEHPYISYDRYADSLNGYAAISFQQNDITLRDTISFYLTSKGNGIPPKSVERWDMTYKLVAPNGVKMLIMHKKGCGNSNVNTNIGRRPVIIAPPYRPGIQPFSPNKYWDQFDFKSVMASISNMGYDIYFIKFRKKYGHESLELNGDAVAWFINEVNILKKYNYPNEHNENIVMGYSMGGQVTRYALRKMEKNHMENGANHHHSRLYSPFDSPHHSVNIPLFAQAIYYDYQNTNPFANLAYKSLVDEASKDMCYYHWLGSTKQDLGQGDIRVTPYPATERSNFQNAVSNSFLHQYSFPNDERRSFPAFTRNISISTGNADKDYKSEYTLTPEKLLFEQDAIVFGVGFPKYKQRRVYASGNSGLSKIYKNKVWTIFIMVPIVTHNVNYRTINALELDMASGGYKDEFYDKWIIGVVPISPISVLRHTGNLWGHKYYDKHMSFLPTTSALAIRPSIWQNNNLFYDLKGNGLMFKNAFDLQNNIKSNTYGYPNLGRPTDHFTITPFEAIYCDPQTYEHIKMKESVSEDALNDNYLVYLRDFILDEVEADIVCLQNKTIGKNHKLDATYKYKAWYKAYDQILIGNQVTPKTDPGDYIIEKTGDITVRAQNSISIKPGFHAQAGSTFQAYIGYDGCSRPRE